ncbi:hypothetical protein [Tianweitania sp.]|uniref:hypothetical protein n=1 Tax=Tianweitania sp. TaxID=2021634 RepID=UPI002896C5AB|nr:hypothetical protein [Tianweitania sp.]
MNTVLLNGPSVKRHQGDSCGREASFRPICLEKLEIFFCVKPGMMQQICGKTGHYLKQT